MKKADISMNVIVYAAIALLILVILVAFATGRLGGLFKGLGEQTTGDLESVVSGCTKDCSVAKTNVQNIGKSAWKLSAYCQEKHAYDSGGDGNINDTEHYHCWQPPINVVCTTTVGAGETCEPEGSGDCVCE